MSCCTTMARAPLQVPKQVGGAMASLDLMVPDVHCAGCISKVERAVLGLEGVSAARLNLTTRRLSVRHADGLGDDRIIAAVEAQGYTCRPFDAAVAGSSVEDREGRRLLRALAVAGFAAGNVMLLSVSVWSGAEGATRELFHWISALIALPAIAIAGQPFFQSAWRALRQRHLNMDVPISLAVLLAGLLSLDATFKGGDEAFFDAAVMLLFFLLVGRYLDHRVRARARNAVSQLLSLWAVDATRLADDGSRQRVPIDQVVSGDLLLVAAGERMPVDGKITLGKGDLDCAIVTGEADPVTVAAGDMVKAGTLCLTHPLTVRATAVGKDTFLSQVVGLMEGAERSRGRHVLLADRAARIYAPAVHLVAALTFAGWIMAGAGWGEALWIAVSVLIITCPCALGLAVPAVQVVASGTLFRSGILLKDGGALERLAEADRAVFDKTGTMTMGRPQVVESTLSPDHLALAASLAGNSRHPLAMALCSFSGHEDGGAATDVTEYPGQGLSGVCDGRALRLGSRDFVGISEAEAPDGPELWFSVNGNVAGQIRLEDALRPGAADTIAALKADGLDPVLLSGDNAASVSGMAERAGFATAHSGLLPAEKIAAIEAMKAEGQRPLMVGDGINDAPALAAAHVSVAPASASDVGRSAADLVFTGDSLVAITFARRVAIRARRLILQNFGLALTYNLIAVPVAVLGGASPLVAAIAMSSSSIIVTLNALRLRQERTGRASA